MLGEHDGAALESLVRRMTDKQRSGLEAWISGGYPFPFGAGQQWAPDGPLWPDVKEAQESRQARTVRKKLSLLRKKRPDLI